MLKIAIIGCGKIADSHAEQIQRIPGAELIAACDKESLMAEQLAERFNINGVYDSVEKMLEEANPDVVHITTPPQSHLALGTACLNAGCHIYMEKPFTVTLEETDALLALAEKVGRKITVGHDYQFTHAKNRLRHLVKSGYLGSQLPIHIESYHCYELGGQAYAKALLGDKNHWVRSLPGGLMHNNISHGICSIAEFLEGDNINVLSYGYQSSVLKALDENEIIDEARIIISDGDRRTAVFVFSTQMRPTLHATRIYGTHNAIYVDHDQQTCIRVKGFRRKSYLEKFLPPLDYIKEYSECLLRNMWSFLRMDFHMKSGMKILIGNFYNSIINDRPVPIPYKEIRLTSRLMDEIFLQLKSRTH